MFSPDDLEKPAKFDMELFKPIIKEYPSLSSFEGLVFQQLKTHYELINSLVVSGRDIYPSTLLINGAVVRSLNEYRGALWAIGNGNPHVFFNCLRSHCETLALIHYCTLHPDYVGAATVGALKHPEKELQIVRISKMVGELEKVHKGISLDYGQLCELVHPNPKSLYASIQPIETKDKKMVVLITSRSSVTDETAKRYLDMLTIWTSWIFEELVQLYKIFK